MQKRGHGKAAKAHQPSTVFLSDSSGKTGAMPRWKMLLTILKIKNDKTMIEKLKSRKLWAAVIGSAIVALGGNLGLSPDVVQWVGTIVTGYIVGQGIADAGANGGSQS